MSRGIRQDTLYRIKAERDAEPLALGPFLGDLSTSLGLPASLVAQALGVHEQTVIRWFFGARILPRSLKQVMDLLQVLVWMRDEHKFLRGLNNEERKLNLKQLTDEFYDIQRGGREQSAV